jgi:putative peptidoglycan lipid II flippase
MPNNSITKNSTWMAIGTITSRITGVIRSAAVIAAIGFGTFADAYSIANSLPTIVYVVVVGGAINSVFVPQLVRHMKNDVDGGVAYTNKLLTLVGLILFALTLLAVIFAPQIVSIYAPNSWSDETLYQSVFFARLLLPQVFFYGLYTVLQQVLNSREHFALPMFAPVLNNLVMIITAVLFIYLAHDVTVSSSFTDEEMSILGLGTTLGVMLQAISLIPALRLVKYKFRINTKFRGAGLTTAGNLAFWTIGYVIVNQITYAFITRLAAGANTLENNVGFTSYQNAFLTFILPHSVIAVSLVTALLPRFSDMANSVEITKLSNSINKAAVSLVSLMLPISVIMFFIGQPLAQVLFARGAASIADARSTGFLLSIFIIALVPFSIFYLLLRGFYALEDTKTPFFINIVLNLINLFVAIYMFNTLGENNKVTGLVIGYVSSYVLVTPLLWYFLNRKGLNLKTSKFLAQALKPVAAVVITGLSLYFIGLEFDLFATKDSFAGALIQVITWGLSGSLIYFVLSFIFKIEAITTTYRKIIK